MHCRNSLLFDEENIWIKQENQEFDVAIGAYEGAEVFELVDLYLIDILSNVITSSDIGLNGDDGLAILRDSVGPNTERILKEVIRIQRSTLGILKVTTISVLILCQSRN